MPALQTIYSVTERTPRAEWVDIVVKLAAGTTSPLDDVFDYADQIVAGADKRFNEQEDTNGGTDESSAG